MSYSVSGTTITLTRGDTFVALISITKQDGTPYVPNDGDKVRFAMKNNGAVEGTISSKDEEYTVPQGFHDGSGKVKIHADEKAKLVANNIREGVTILGVAGSMTGTEGANPQAKTVTPSTSQQEILPDSESGYNYLSQVTVLAIPYSEAENQQGGTTVTIG